ncbi:ATP-binding protein [Streptomyces sp. Li-HN-5-11]|uniref:ATP-binding protein n=1 Tax=Streptomyces sp. Li-HN-5-11 TaxID=3075432 RepID=UPI0028A8CA3C|nr:ATP-binding protein [Streptomyces sp. Li-HN-5-11]WNM36759.1 ATP-binding protein [Streptomyces sp. Li-HN-5-11]
MDCTGCMPRRAWELPFLAEAEEVAALRRLLRLHLEFWGLQELSEAAELCVSELVANVIKHVGPGTPTTLAVRMNGTRLRIEVHDPDPRALPTLADADSDAESGRGMALIDALTDRWGVDLTVGRKATWCELRTSGTADDGHVTGPRMARAADVLGFYASSLNPSPGAGVSRLKATVAEEAAIGVITDLLHWLQAHGRDSEQVLDRAQVHFEAEVQAH